MKNCAYFNSDFSNAKYISLLISDYLKEKIKVKDVYDNEGFSWEIDCEVNGIKVFILVGFIEEDNEWLITIDPTFKFFSFIFKNKYNLALNKTINLINKFLNSDNRFKNIRWVSSKELE